MSSRKRTHSCVLLAVVVAPSLQGCLAPRPSPPFYTAGHASQKPRAQALLTPEEEILVEEACCALDAGEAAALSSRFPSSRSALVLEEILRRQMARKRIEFEPRPRTVPPPSVPLDEPGARRAFLEARVLVEKGKLQDACDRHEDAVALDPGNEEYRAALASACKQAGLELYGKGDYRTAALYWRRTLEIRPDDEEAQSFLRRASRVIENR